MSIQMECLPKETAAAKVPEETGRRAVFIPRADIYETEHNLVVLADLPGADENSIDITVEKNVLCIHATSCCEAPAGHSLCYGEYDSGDFERKFTLPSEIDRNGITATMKNGVLRLTLPKSAESRLKKISVTAE